MEVKRRKVAFSSFVILTVLYFLSLALLVPFFYLVYFVIFSIASVIGDYILGYF